MRRMLDDDVVSVDAALGHLDLAMHTLRQVDLRTYGGDPELREKIRQAKDDMKDARGRLREARALKWRK